LLDGQSAGMLIFKAQELPVGIAFVGLTTDLDAGTAHSRLYLGHQPPDGFTFAPAGPDRDLCSGGYALDVAWDPQSLQAAVSCHHGLELISLDGRVDVDLGPFLEPIEGDNSIRAFWGPE